MTLTTLCILVRFKLVNKTNTTVTLLYYSPKSLKNPDVISTTMLNGVLLSVQRAVTEQSTPVWC